MTRAGPHTAIRRERPPSASELGVRANSANWIDAPFNRWGFSHVRDLTRTMPIRRGEAPVRQLPARSIDLGSVPVDHAGDSFTYIDMLHATYTDACVVVHDGHIVFEYYDVGIRADQPHLLMSVSKSLTATLIGVLVGQGVVEPEGLVTDYVTDLRNTAWAGCTVQHLLDMRAGIRFSEDDMDDLECDGVLLEQVSGYTTGSRPNLPATTADWIRILPSQQAHGGPFAYRSILVDVLGWIAEAVTGERFADLFSRLIWQRLGVEQDGDLIVDAAGFPVVEGGFCTTARDLARFGVMHLQRGEVSGTQVVPGEWIDRVVTRDPTYTDCWWVGDITLGCYSGYGLGGQQLLIDRSSQTVVVKLSSWPKRTDPLLAAFADEANMTILDWLRRT